VWNVRSPSRRPRHASSVFLRRTEDPLSSRARGACPTSGPRCPNSSRAPMSPRRLPACHTCSASLSLTRGRVHLCALQRCRDARLRAGDGAPDAAPRSGGSAGNQNSAARSRARHPAPSFSGESGRVAPGRACCSHGSARRGHVGRGASGLSRRCFSPARPSLSLHLSSPAPLHTCLASASRAATPAQHAQAKTLRARPQGHPAAHGACPPSGGEGARRQREGCAGTEARHRSA
jgi:hypothetical protein